MWLLKCDIRIAYIVWQRCKTFACVGIFFLLCIFSIPDPYSRLVPQTLVSWIFQQLLQIPDILSYKDAKGQLYTRSQTYNLFTNFRARATSRNVMGFSWGAFDRISTWVEYLHQFGKHLGIFLTIWSHQHKMSRTLEWYLIPIYLSPSMSHES